MTDSRDYKSPEFRQAVIDVLKSDDTASALEGVLIKALQKSAIELSRYAKKCRCSRCCPPPVACRPQLPVMWMPIPIPNFFWWTQACQPPQPPSCRPHCGPSLPECGHEHPYTPKPEHPGAIA